MKRRCSAPKIVEFGFRHFEELSRKCGPLKVLAPLFWFTLYSHLDRHARRARPMIRYNNYISIVRSKSETVSKIYRTVYHKLKR